MVALNESAGNFAVFEEAR